MFAKIYRIMCRHMIHFMELQALLFCILLQRLFILGYFPEIQLVVKIIFYYFNKPRTSAVAFILFDQEAR